jgi:hypothetical protein
MKSMSVNPFLKRMEPMGYSLPLDKMTTSEKLAALELLWEDLCQCPDNIASPAWHGKVLADREEKISDGASSFSDLNEAKRRIGKATK